MKNLKFDFAAGLVVFFVALPLCLGISLIATGGALTPEVIPGIIAGVVGGIIVGFFSGSKFGVSGPAAGLITIVTASVIELGGFADGGYEKFVLAVLIAGIIQLILGFLKAGFIAYYIPYAVIKGMLAGIGLIIVLKELPHFLGYDKHAEGSLAATNTYEDIYNSFINPHVGAIIIAVISLVILIVWGMKAIKNNKVLSLVPGPLLAIIVAVLVSLLFGNMFAGNEGLVVDGNHLVKVPTSIDSIKNQLHFPDFSALADWRVYKIALIIAIVASIETLLCVEATDKLDPNKGRTPMDRELKAQGIGNIISGLVGGLPITQVIIRSSANIGAGAKSKNSAIIHGVFLLVFILAIPGVLNMIPRSTLAAILVLIGFKLASPKMFTQMFKGGLSQFVPFVATIAGMLATDLLTGVGIGLGVAILWILYKNYKVSYFVEGFGHKEGEPIKLVLSQHATFLNKASIVETFDTVPNGEHVILDLSKTIDLDYDIQEAIKEFKMSCIDRNIKLEIVDQVLKPKMNQGLTI